LRSDLSGLIAVFDSNGDGTVTLEEFKAALQVRTNRLLRSAWRFILAY
jgi:Ca2+-binding EF-hand superfamily protein